MFDFIRSHQRLMQFILLILVVPSFVFLGISGYSFVTADAALAVVDQMSVTRDAFTEAQRNQLQRMQEATQGRFDPAQLDTPEARQALLDQLIDQQVQVAVATHNYFSVSDAALRRVIAAMPQLQDDGRFSPERYHEILASYGMTPRDFEASQRAQLALGTVLDPIRETVSLPGPVVQEIERALTEARTVRLRIFPAAAHREQVQVSDQDIQTWYDAHQDALRLPEQVSANYLVLDEAAALASVPAVEDSQLKDYYNQNKTRYVVPARVDLSHILIKVPRDASKEARAEALANAEDLAKQARADTAHFAELARAQSQDAGTARDGGHLGWLQEGSLPGALASVAFGLKAGEVSDPVEGPEGYHVFMANQVQPEKGETFEEARSKVEHEVRQQLAAERYADMATKLTDLVYDDSSSLEPAAKELGLEVRHAGGIARDRLLSVDEAGPDAASGGKDAEILGDPRVRQALFSAQVYNDKQNSGLIEISPDTMAVVRINTVSPAHVPPLEQVSAHIRETLIDERALKLAEDEGEGILAQLREKSDSQDFEEPLVLTRLNATGLSKDVLDTAFSLPDESLPSYGGVTLPQAYVIVQLDKVQPGTTESPELTGLGAQLAQLWANLETRAVLDRLRSQMKVELTDTGRQLITQGDNT